MSFAKKAVVARTIKKVEYRVLYTDKATGERITVGLAARNKAQALDSFESFRCTAAVRPILQKVTTELLAGAE